VATNGFREYQTPGCVQTVIATYGTKKKSRKKKGGECIISGIYRIHNETQNIAYVGASLDVNRRIGEHMDLLRCGKHPLIKMQVDYDAGDMFKAEALFVSENNHETDDLMIRLAVVEQMYIDEQAAVYNKNEAPIRATLINKYLRLGVGSKGWEQDLANHIRELKTETGL